MFVEHKESKKKIYIKYYTDKILKTQTLYSIVEDLFHLDNILSKNDDLMIIIKDEPNNTLNQDIKEIWMQENIYVSLLNIKRLQFNILKHSLVPKHTILTKEEEQGVVASASSAAAYGGSLHFRTMTIACKK